MKDVNELDEEDLRAKTPSRVEELLVQDGGTSHYFNEFLLSKILAEVSARILDLPNQINNEGLIYE